MDKQTTYYEVASCIGTSASCRPLGTTLAGEAV